MNRLIEEVLRVHSPMIASDPRHRAFAGVGHLKGALVSESFARSTSNPIGMIQPN
jgi:hypothetical protein